MQSSKHLTVCLLASTIGLFPLPALAQIPVTSGRITGEAAFFRPVSGNTVFFDLGTRTLRLETPNGVTVDSRFLPTSAQLEAIGNRLPTTGDRGVLDGLLSGRAFNQAGSPVFFSNIATRLNFTINSFVPITGNLAGTLIESPASSKVFVPVIGVRLDPTVASFFSTSEGILTAGAFDARLPSGVISLPSTFRFGTPLVNEFTVPDTVTFGQRGFNFRLEGIGIPNPPGTPGDSLGSFFDPFFAGGVRFSSANATTNFTVQLDGTALNITGSGNFSTLIEIQGINPASSGASPLLPGNNPLAPAVRYSIIGRGSGSVTNSEPLRFSSGLSTTTFLFQDNFGNFAQGISAGATNFVIAGADPFTVSSFSNLIPTSSINAITIDNTGIFVAAPIVPPPALIGTARRNTTSSPISGGQVGVNVATAPTPILENLFLPPITTANVPGAVQVQTPSGTLVGVPDPAIPGTLLVVSAPEAIINPLTGNLGGSIDISAINPAAGQATDFINAVMRPLSAGGVLSTGSVQEIEAFTQQQNRRNVAIGGLVNAEVAWNNTMTSIRQRDARIQTANEERAARMEAWRAIEGIK